MTPVSLDLATNGAGPPDETPPAPPAEDLADQEAREDEARGGDDPAWDSSGQDRLAQLASVLGAPTTGRVVIDGKKGPYYEADPEFRHPSSGSVHAKMAGLGYEPIGGLLCRRFQRYLVRGWARQGGTAWGLLLLAPVAYRVVEFHTTLGDGSTLITTTHPAGPGDEPARRIFRERVPGASVTDLEARHRARVQDRLERGGVALATEPSLETLARTLDAFLVRRDA